MIRSIQGLIFSLLTFSIGYLVAATTVASHADESRLLDAKFLKPPVANGSCTAEQTAYANAYADFLTAQNNVTQTWYAWHECENGGRKDIESVNPISAEYSILER